MAKNRKDNLATRHRADSHARRRAATRDAQDVGKIPQVRNRRRKKAAHGSLETFCLSYLPMVFTMPFSDDHRLVISRLETAVHHGGTFALAMPRGHGKSSLCIGACLWSLLYGFRLFLVLFGASKPRAEEMLQALRTQLRHNNLLFDDFPRELAAIRHLDGEPRRASGQHHNGKPTGIQWTQSGIVMPTIKGSACSGSVIRCLSLDSSAVRGQQFTAGDGSVRRPDLVLIDDPQSREVARSPFQVAQLEALIRGDVLGLAGPKRTAATVMPVTAIYPDDLASRFLDQKRNPQWQGQRMRLMQSMPVQMDLWEQYAKIRNEELARGAQPEAARRFYADHRAQMDTGAVASWEQRFDPESELSAVQAAMNLFFDRGKEAFMSEFQNEPESLREFADVALLTHEEICGKTNGIPRGIVPANAAALTVFVDVHAACLVWATVGWSNTFGGGVCGYGVYPEQPGKDFNVQRVERSLQTLFPGLSREAAIASGIGQLLALLVGKEWPREGGGAVRVNTALVDYGYEAESVIAAVRRSPHASMLLPSKGHGISAVNKPLSEYTKHRGDVFRPHVHVLAPSPTQPIRTARYDTNALKRLVHDRLAAPIGSADSLALFGLDPREHEVFARHLLAETPIKVEARGRVVYEWKQLPGTQNHYFDAVVGCAAGAIIAGITIPGQEQPPPAPRPRVSAASAEEKRLKFLRERGFA